MSDPGSSDGRSLREVAVALLSTSGSRHWPPAIDVSAFLAWATTEGVLGLLYGRARRDGAADHLPPALLEGLRAGAHRQAAMELALRLELRRLVAAIRTGGVDMLLMKGASLAYDVYPDPAWRVRCDVDLLIRAADRDTVRACLDDLGYVEPQVARRLYQFQSERIDARGIRHLCDVHWKIANPQRFADLVLFDELAQAAVPIPALGPDARGLGRAHALWLACVHQVAHHSDRDALPWLYDVHLLIEALDAGDVARFIALAERTGVRRICLRAALLARTRFGTIIPPTALAALEAAPADEPSAGFLRPGLRPLDVLLDDLRMLAGWRARLTLLKEHLFPSAAYLRRTYAGGSSAPLLWLYVRRIVAGAWKWFRPIGDASDERMRRDDVAVRVERIPMLSDRMWWRLARIHKWTNGLSTELLNRVLVIGRRAQNTATAKSETCHCEMSLEQIAQYADEVRRHSHSLLPIRLDPSVCDDVVAHCLSLKCMPFPRPTSGPEEIALDVNRPVAPLNFFEPAQGVHRHPAVAALMNDPVLVAVARDYLGCEPILGTCQIWASPAFGEGPSSEATQLFHYDAMHPRFIKFFVYLTDVDSDNGPHCVVPTSHRPDIVGWKLRFGATRISDEQIERAYPGMTRELVGPKGTVIAEDTRAFHKGKQPTRGCRFVLELYFVNALVGKAIPEAERLRRECHVG